LSISSLIYAFVAGFLSFLSPCTLPLYPSYLSYLTGVSFDQLQLSKTPNVRKKAIIHALFFILGFSIVFVGLGFTASLIGEFFISYKILVRTIGGAFIILMGFFLLGWIQWDFLFREKKWHLSNKPAGYLGSILVGITFAAGWTPCIGPILGSVIALAATSPRTGGILLLAYTLGFAIPFFLLALTLGSVKWIQKYAPIFAKVGGVIMVVMGILLLTDEFSRLTAWLIQATGFRGF
jgi:cytochrome c-type biogenesis protein